MGGPSQRRSENILGVVMERGWQSKEKREWKLWKQQWSQIS